MQHRPMAIAISFALAASPAIAQTTDVQPASSTDVASKPDSNLERMVVVSSRVAMPIREIATSVSVLTRDDIETRGCEFVAKKATAPKFVSMASRCQTQQAHKSALTLVKYKVATSTALKYSVVAKV